MLAQHGRGLTRRVRSTNAVSVRWLAVTAVVFLSVFRFMQAPAVLAASVDAPHLLILPAVVAPGEQLTVILRMGSIPANFTLPHCAVVDITSSVLAARNGGVLAVTVTGPGSFYAEGTVPSNTAPGSYGVQARACGIVWATATFEVTMPMPDTGAALSPVRLGGVALLLSGGVAMLFAAWGSVAWRRREGGWSSVPVGSTARATGSATSRRIRRL
jgi:hypothetical protein